MSKKFALLRRFREKNLSLIDKLWYYRNTLGGINYASCVLTESSAVLYLLVIVLKTFDHSSEGVAPLQASHVFGSSRQSSFYLHIYF